MFNFERCWIGGRFGLREDRAANRAHRFFATIRPSLQALTGHAKPAFQSSGEWEALGEAGEETKRGHGSHPSEGGQP
jgi:hypothetical protein